MTEETWSAAGGSDGTRDDAAASPGPIDAGLETVDDARTGHVRTGVPRVDAVLEEMDGLDDLPLDEHVSAFERAHEALRSALDADPDASA